MKNEKLKKIVSRTLSVIAMILIGYLAGFIHGCYEMQVDMFQRLHQGWFWGIQICWELDQNLALVMVDEYHVEVGCYNKTTTPLLHIGYKNRTSKIRKELIYDETLKLTKDLMEKNS